MTQLVLQEKKEHFTFAPPLFREEKKEEKTKIFEHCLMYV